ncbi:aminopeptidase N [Streptomyces sp. NPDC050560]|uniref:aminopeptidase N n=1 Tax=Streptomyces sp. NPDC050560 TaxID=3365630 RepID=UPI00379B86FF
MCVMSVLTRGEAQTRARLLDVHRYTVDLDVTGGDTFGARTTIAFTVTPDGDATPAADTGDTVDTFAELRAAALRSATLDGQPLPEDALHDGRLHLTGLTPGPHELTTDARMPYSHTGEGMHRFTDPGDGETYLYTQLFLDDAPRVFTAFDQPDLKARFDLTVTAPKGWTVLANTAVEHLGEGRWRAATTPPISTYLAAVAAGPWHSIRTRHRGIPFALHCRRSLAPHLDADADELLGITRACFDRYHEKFEEPYPFDSYDQAFVPEFNAGAMENPGLVTFTDDYVFRSAVTDTERQLRGMVVAHEMAHMWFGNLVTLRWWDDMWLNESFAEYMGYQTLAEATRHTGTWTQFAIARKAWGYDADQRPSTHPVAPEDVPDCAAAHLNFDGISYAKGASALRQLVTWLGEKNFLAGINTHFARHRFGNATLADLIDSLALHTDRDVRGWAESWLRTTGIDTLTPTVTTGQGTWTLHVHHQGQRPHRLAVGLYDRDPVEPGALLPRGPWERDFPGTGTDTALTGEGTRPALVLLNDQDLGYAKIRLDDQSWDTALRSLSGLPDPVTRAVVWNTARDMVRDAELPPAAYLDAARTHLPHESDLAIVQGVLAFATTHVAGAYLTGEGRAAALGTLTALCRDLIRRTEDGENPGLRLLAVRHLVATAAQPATIHTWFTDDTVPGGPELDPELRWHILTRLATLGATDEDTIAAELSADPSGAGHEGAARCRAALPDPAAKAHAWDAMLHPATGDELSNHLLAATARGFWQPEQTHLTADHAARYFDEAPTVAQRRGTAIARVLTRDAFPGTHLDTDTLHRGERCLTRDDLTPAFRRGLTDRLDDLRRALRVNGTLD